MEVGKETTNLTIYTTISDKIFVFTLNKSYLQNNYAYVLMWVKILHSNKLTLNYIIG